ncbi:MAG: XylB [Planctomycetota bacterium]|jgi:xylulokinase|nr:XylB [Planctomycetota bacterium]
MAELLLGIDSGSSSVKVCVYARSGGLLGRSSRRMRLAHPRPSWAEMDADAIWSETAAAVREAMNGVRGKVAGIGVSTACPTTVFLDGNLKPLRPAIVYLDGRSNRTVERFGERHGAAGHFARTGNRLSCSTSWLANLAWLRENEPDTWKRVRRVSLLGGYLTLRMAGRPVVDWTQASYSGGFRVGDPGAGWDEALLAKWEIDKTLLAETGWSCLPAGVLNADAARDMGIEPGAIVAFGSADTAASAFALGMRNSGEIFESAGTSGVITFCLDRPLFDDAFMNRCHVFPGRWLAHGAMSTLGGAFNWLRQRVWPDLGGMEELEDLAGKSPPGANGLVFLPYLAGERSPIWDPGASGLWLGLRMDHDRGDLIRAVFEGTAFGLKQIIERGKRFWGCSPDRLPGVGGGARSRLWSEIKSDILGVEYLCADEPDAAAWGAAAIGGVAAGAFSGVEDSDLRFIAAKSAQNTEPSRPNRLSARFNPHSRERREKYANAFSVYETLYPALKTAMHDLAKNGLATASRLSLPR